MTGTNDSRIQTTWEDLLDFAVDKEREATAFYAKLAKSATNTAMRNMFSDLSAIERGHEVRLKRVKASGRLAAPTKRVVDLKIADYLTEVEPSPAMNYQETLIVAMKREEAAHNLYTDLAAVADEKDVREAMLALADEEAQHKLRFETEYDEQVLKDN